MARQPKQTNHWQYSEARAKLSEVVRRARTVGPQFVTRRDGEQVVFWSVEEYERSSGKRITRSKVRGSK